MVIEKVVAEKTMEHLAEALRENGIHVVQVIDHCTV